MSRFRVVPSFPFVAILLTGCSSSSSGPILNGTPSGPPSSTDVATYHYDNQRTGENLKETALDTSNVNSARFGRVGECAVDGQIDGQTLFLSQLAIPGQGNKDVLYVATENDTVYAVDAQSISGSSATILWKTSVLPNGESPATSLPCGNIRPNGITATPVIDRARNAIYVEAMSQNSTGNIFHRLHALDLTNGGELFGGPTTITATYPGTGGNSSGGVVSFLPQFHHERAALLEAGNTIYTAWAGLLLLPDMTDASGTLRHLAVGAGKDGNLYVLNRDNLGQFNSTKNNIYQPAIQLATGENHSSPVFFQNTVYLGPTNNALKAFPVSQALLGTSPSSQSAHLSGSNGAVASMSANGASQGIVWALAGGVGMLFAYDARDLTKELYDSNQAASNRDHFSAVGGHFITPMVANGRVYVGTRTSVAVFGLL